MDTPIPKEYIESVNIALDIESTKAALILKTWRTRLYGTEFVKVFIGKDRLYAFLTTT